MVRFFLRSSNYHFLKPALNGPVNEKLAEEMKKRGIKF